MQLLLILGLSAALLIVFNMFIVGEPRRSRRLPQHPHPRALPGRGRERGRKPRRQAETSKEEEPPTKKPFNVYHLQPGDVVMYQEQDFLVAERRTIQEDSWEWTDYTLEDGEDLIILSANPEQEELFWLSPLYDLDLSYPPPNELNYKRTPFTMTSAGQAEIVETDERFRYYTYEEPSQLQVIVAEDWGAQWELFRGERVREQDLSLLPGSQR